MCFYQPTHRLFVVWYAIILHWLWGCMLLASNDPLAITAINAVSRFGLVYPSSASILYFFVSSLAIIGIMAPRPVGLIFLIPQQIVLYVSAYGAILAMSTGRFADGVQRTPAFLIADQAPAVIIAFLYTFVVIELARRK